MKIIGKTKNMQKVTIEGNVAIIDGEEFDLVPKKKKDYEILSFRYTQQDYNNYAIRGTDGLYRYKGDEENVSGSTLKGMLTEGNGWSIYSVKYLPTGEVITIGDVGNLTNGNGYKCKVSKLELSYNEHGLIEHRGRETCKFYFNTNNGYELWGPFELDKFQRHTNNYIMTSYDGHAIHEDDILYYTPKGPSIFMDIVATTGRSEVKGNKEKVYFANKNEAEKYVDLNRKQLSKQQIVNTLEELNENGRVSIRELKNVLGI